MTQTLEPLITSIVEQPAQFSRREVSALAGFLAAELANDPLQQWLFPENSQRHPASERFFGRLLVPRLKAGQIAVCRSSEGKLASVAVWTPPYPPAPSRWERLCDSIAMRRVHGKRLQEIRVGFTALAARHPPQPYWYLLALATASHQRGRGFASDLLESKICECDASGQPIALETSLQGNLSFYARFGFQIENELMLPGGPTVWLLYRKPV